MKRFVYQEAKPALHRIKGKTVAVPVKREIITYLFVRGGRHTPLSYHPSKYPASRYSKTLFARGARP